MSRARLPVLLVFLWVAAGCARESADLGHDHGAGGHDHGAGGHDHGDGNGHPDEGGSWAVTAWGDHFEVFAEADPLVAGEISSSHTHVTDLRDFSPLTEGLVEIVLRRDGKESVFGEELPLRDGIFDVVIRAPDEGVYELVFRIEGGAGGEEFPAGHVRVGTGSDPGGLVESGGPDAGGEVVSFLKEQQWKTRFATTWAEEDSLALVARGPGRVRPMAGGEVVLAAPMSAVVRGDPWPHVGREVTAGDRLFTLMPHVAADRSLAELEAVETQKRAARDVAEERRKRLESLLPAQASSPAEVEAARAHAASLRAQHEAALSDLRTARAGRAGAAAHGSVPVISPLAGQVADIRVSPGQVVAAGEPLGRVVRVEPFWVEVFLRPAQALDLVDASAGLALRAPGMELPLSIPAESVRLVSRSPEVSPLNGTVACVFEVIGNASPLLGSSVEAEVTLPKMVVGVVIPASALVDDGGTPVVYTQVDGEGFLRREIEITARQGSSVLVRGVSPGDRIVSIGGSMIRRATLVSSGVGHGHVH